MRIFHDHEAFNWNIKRWNTKKNSFLLVYKLYRIEIIVGRTPISERRNERQKKEKYKLKSKSPPNTMNVNLCSATSYVVWLQPNERNKAKYRKIIISAVLDLDSWIWFLRCSDGFFLVLLLHVTPLMTVSTRTLHYLCTHFYGENQETPIIISERSALTLIKNALLFNYHKALKQINALFD